MRKPMAYITAAWSDNEFEVTETAAKYCRKLYDAGYTPICPPLYLPLYLNDKVPQEHKDGIDIARDMVQPTTVLHSMKLLNRGHILAWSFTTTPIMTVCTTSPTLDKMSSKYTTASLHNTYASVYAHIAVCRTGDMVKEHWKQLNPYFRKEYARENLFKKDLIDILDDFFQNIVSICPNDFLMPLSNFDYLLRGRRKEWRLAQDLMPPSIEFSIAHNIINRWNPPEKRYLYLVNGIANSPENDTVCFEEMRIKKDETVTIANFHIAKAAYHKKVINLNFDDVTRQDIFDFVNVGQKKQTHDLIEQIYTQKISPTKENIKNQIELQTMETTQLACSFCGKLLLKEICDAIFVPLDSDEDNDAELKDQCYKSFHILAEYFENKGIAGIVFPSTRMRLLNKTGSNLVLFSVDDAFPDVGTYRIVKK